MGSPIGMIFMMNGLASSILAFSVYSTDTREVAIDFAALVLTIL